MCMTNSKEAPLTVKPLHAIPTSTIHVILLPEVNVKRQEINTKTCLRLLFQNRQVVRSEVVMGV